MRKFPVQGFVMRRFVAATLVAMLGVVGLAACGGGDDDGGDDGAAEQQDDSGDSGGGDSGDGSDSGDDGSGDSGDDGSGDGGSGDGDSGDGGSGDGGSGDGEFAELLERQSDAVIKVTYDMDGEEMIVAQDHSKRATYSGSSVMITTEDGTVVSCDGVDGDDPTCTEMPEGFGDIAQLGTGLGFMTVLAEQLVQASSQFSGIDTSSEEIAGRDAQCAQWDASSFLGMAAAGEDGSAEICIDDETGYLLKFETKGEGTAQLIVAKKVEDPDDSDFEPPAEVEENPLGDFDYEG